MGNVLSPTRKTENHQDLAGMLSTLDAECRNCAPISPLQCINRCQAYKLKNELRKLRETMDNPNYLKELFNVLKNETRLHILQAIVNGRYSVSRLQQELKKTGHSHSQDTISEEYLGPLMAVGLATEARDEYYATTFGGRLTELLEDFPNLLKCYRHIQNVMKKSFCSHFCLDQKLSKILKPSFHQKLHLEF